MSKSTTDERRHGFKGQQVQGPPPDLDKIRAAIMPDCFCYSCVANRKWLKDEEKRREINEGNSLPAVG